MLRRKIDDSWKLENERYVVRFLSVLFLYTEVCMGLYEGVHAILCSDVLSECCGVVQSMEMCSKSRIAELMKK